MKGTKLIALGMVLALMLALAGCSVEITIDGVELPVAAADPAADPTGTLEENGWYYTVTGGEATVVATADAVKSAEVILFPAELGGYPVTAIGANGTAVVTNADGWVLIPEGVKVVSDGAFYDLNRTPGWSFPPTLEEMP